MISADGTGDPEVGFPRNDSAMLDLGLRVVSDGRYSVPQFPHLLKADGVGLHLRLQVSLGCFIFKLELFLYLKVGIFHIKNCILWMSFKKSQNAQKSWARRTVVCVAVTTPLPDVSWLSFSSDVTLWPQWHSGLSPTIALTPCFLSILPVTASCDSEWRVGRAVPRGPGLCVLALTLC